MCFETVFAAESRHIFIIHTDPISVGFSDYVSLYASLK